MSDIVRSEMQSKAIAVAEAIYRLTSITGFDAPLRDALRDAALKLIVGIAAISVHAVGEVQLGRDTVPREAFRDRIREVDARVEAVKSLLSFARDRGAVSPEHAARVAAACDHLRRFFGELPRDVSRVQNDGSERIPAAPLSAARPLAVLNDRQREILSYLESTGQAQIGSIREILGDTVSEKTLQRDLLQLVANGVIQRLGDNRWTTYLYIGHA